MVNEGRSQVRRRLLLWGVFALFLVGAKLGLWMLLTATSVR